MKLRIPVTAGALALLATSAAQAQANTFALVPAQDGNPAHFQFQLSPLERAGRILGMFDINGGGEADSTDSNNDGVREFIDSDGDGLPDTWEFGGLDPEGTDVPFPTPDAISPGTPPVSIFSRRPVRTSATSRDTDGDGLSDFVEVFGLKFIDDNQNGQLDDACVRDASGSVIFNADGTPLRATDASGAPIGEWFDFNGDGMPSIGEFPAPNVLIAGQTFDYDGFVFTDPTNPDTDGDGISDGADNDPLVNPRSFGVDSPFFPSVTGSTDVDKDNDGLGNGMDLGNDVTTTVDNPTDLPRILTLIRPDLLAANRLPEGLVDDLLGADWNGDGLFRLTDLQNLHFGGVAGAVPSLTAGATPLFLIGNPDTVDPLAPPIVLGFVPTGFPSSFRPTTYYVASLRGTGGVNPPLPYQELLTPTGRSNNEFLPDPRIWTVLYAWRVPGFDIDGNGFIGYDASSFSGTIEVNGQSLTDDQRQALASDPSTAITIAATSSSTSSGAIPKLDGVVQVSFPSFCSGLGFGLVGVGLIGVFWGRRRVL